VPAPCQARRSPCSACPFAWRHELSIIATVVSTPGKGERVWSGAGSAVRRLSFRAAPLSLVLLGLFSGCSGDSSEPEPDTLRGSIQVVDKMWRCVTPVDLDLVQVTIHGLKTDAIHLNRGCTGTIRRLEVVGDGVDLGPRGDAVKVHAGAHDLEILGGTINCARKSPRKHQDAIQAMGGKRVTFHEITSRGCSNSFMFVNFGRSRHEKPEDIVCRGCDAVTRNFSISIRHSVRSGATGGTYVSRAQPRATDVAEEPVLTNNIWQQRVLDPDERRERKRQQSGRG
jgi:hypothetical protein